MPCVNSHDSSMDEKENLLKKKSFTELDHHHNTMFIRIIFILSVLCTLSLSGDIFAANGQSYSDYQEKSKEFCEDPKKDWHE